MSCRSRGDLWWVALVGGALAAPLAAVAANQGAGGAAPSGPTPAPAASPGTPRPTTAPSLLAPVTSPPPPRAEAFELRRADDGSGDLLYRSPGFDARIHPDGRVRFIDHHLGLMFLPFLPYRTNARGPTIESLLMNALMGKRAAPNGAAPAPVDPADQPAPLAPHMSPFRPDPNEGCRYPAPCFMDAAVVVIVGGTFDVTDEVMRLFGKDPYRYQKARFMKATEPMRVTLAARAQADELRRASVQLRPTLEAIAADPSRTEAERRAIIEALAAELDVTTAEGKWARAIIDDFLRARFAGQPVTPAVPAPTKRVSGSR